MGDWHNDPTILSMLVMLDAIMEKYQGTTGIRPLEQAAEHLAAHALYQIEANHVEKVEYTAAMVKELLDIE